MPKITQLEFDRPYDQEVTEATHSGKSYLFDFEKGDYVTRDGKMVPIEGIDAVRQWIKTTMLTEFGRYRVFEGVDHGIRTTGLIGSAYPIDFVKTEYKREIIDALTLHPAITSLGQWSFAHEGSTLHISFRVDTIYGDYRDEVRAIVS
ncbi:DUF2634 domain-containing protein [Geomicrobium sediminis]|uniref:Membrane protein n=1 Tax=Geomicrobium sediminis TaxID=1347788 RepID=A0ABS2P8E9_9BACL|nr:DUF2634 domain-containing protein [Geomicrobium sediminis]MBM7631093.1 putative membrane protein [Geomicrobium sediminis]